MAAKSRSNGKVASPLNAQTRQATARAQAKRLMAVGEAKLEIEGLQIAGDLRDTDPVPGTQPKRNDDGTFQYDGNELVFPTFGELYAENAAAAQRVEKWIDSTGTRSLVEKLLDMEREFEEER